MNRFKIVVGKEKQFEDIWRNRESHLDDVPGFIDFNLIKRSENKDFILYASHSRWKSQNDFSNWTKSDSFRKAHRNSGQHKDVYLGHPEFEGFEVVI